MTMTKKLEMNRKVSKMLINSALIFAVVVTFFKYSLIIVK